MKELLSYYGLEEKFEVLKEWYDGYHFGEEEVYCPWDVINQCDKFREAIDAPMEALISGKAVEKTLIPELTYTDLDSEDQETRQTYLWSVLFPKHP